MAIFSTNKTTQTNIDRIDNEIRALKATLSKQAQEIQKIKDFIGYSDSNKVPNKSRLD